MVSYLVYVNPNKEDNCEVLILVVVDDGLVLSRSRALKEGFPLVLILVVVDDGLVQGSSYGSVGSGRVLILVVVDNGLVLDLIRLF